MFKNKRLNKKYFLVSLIILGSFFVFSLYSGKPDRLEINFLDVGQGDASLIKISNGLIILIDGGPDNTILKQLGNNLNFRQKKINLMIVSHFHDDHVTGLIEILNRYEVEKIIYQTDSPSSEIWEIFLATAQNKSISLITLDRGMQISLADNCLLDLLNPESLGIAEDENNSILVKLNCQGVTALFTGDNNEAVEKALLHSGWNIQSDILKISHHGSKTANSEAFLRQVNPQKAIISVGADNRFNHPSPEVIDRLSGLGIAIYRTDQQGNIKIFSQY